MLPTVSSMYAAFKTSRRACSISIRELAMSNTYRGPVVLYYPETLPHTPENDLDLAVAQVKQDCNLAEGIASGQT